MALRFEILNLKLLRIETMRTDHRMPLLPSSASRNSPSRNSNSNSNSLGHSNSSEHDTTTTTTTNHNKRIKRK